MTLATRPATINSRDSLIKKLTVMPPDSRSLTESFNETREQIHRQMLSAVSHDLKTPLATIIGSLEVHTRMAQKLTPEKKAVLIRSALMEAYRLDNFITNILDMAKLEGGVVKIKLETCDLTQLVKDCITRLGPKSLHAKISLHPGKNTVVEADYMLLSRAAGLVLENAVQHSGRHPVIDVEYAGADNETYIRVRDHGHGIPNGKEAEIFSKYTRFDRNDYQNAGTGLGLAICQKLMQLISGEVKVRNHPQGGAEFTLLLSRV